MNLKKSTKILLGVVTMWPIAYMLVFFIGIFLMLSFMPGETGSAANDAVSPLVPMGFLGFFAVHMLTILLSMGLMAFYIVRVFKTPLDEAMKIMWTVLICMFGILAMPVFWYLYIWREPPALKPGQAQLSSAPTASVNSTEWSSRRENEYNPQGPPDWR